MPFPGAGIFGHHTQSAHIAGFVIRSAHNNQAAPRSFAHGIQPRLLHHAVHHFNGGLKALPSASASEHAGGQGHHGHHNGDNDNQFHQGKPFAP